MTRQFLPLRYGQRGSVLLLALVFLVVLGRMAISGLDKAQLNQRLLTNINDRAAAMHAAESALVYAERRFHAELQASGLTSVSRAWAPHSDRQMNCESLFDDGDELVGFNSLASQPRYLLSVQPFPLDEVAEYDAGLPVACGTLYRASACGTGRRAQTVVSVQSELFVCCESTAKCEDGLFSLEQRRWWVSH